MPLTSMTRARWRVAISITASTSCSRLNAVRGRATMVAGFFAAAGLGHLVVGLVGCVALLAAALFFALLFAGLGWRRART